MDATYVRVHAHGNRARGGYRREAIGRSRGGLTSKVHLLTDALGYPVRFVVTGGERNDVAQAVTGGVKCSHDGRGQKQPPRVGRLVMKEG